MSFAALAVRTCLVQALRGQTLAGDSVEDSPADPASLAASSAGPVVCVSSDREVLRPRGRSLMAGSVDSDLMCADLEGLRPLGRSFVICAGDLGTPHANVVDLALSVFLPAKSVIPVPGQADVQVDAQPGGMALAFDLIWRQVTRVLALDDAAPSGGVWADLWRRAVNGVVAVEHGSPAGTPADGAQLPSRRIVMRLDVLDEPAFGDLRSDFWPDFVAAAKTCPDLAGVAPVIEQAIQGDDLPEWRALAALLGLRPDDMAPLGLGPLGGGPTDAFVPLSEVAVDGADPAAPDGALTVAPDA